MRRGDGVDDDVEATSQLLERPFLTPGASVQFRYRAVLKAGEGDWSQPTTLIVR